VVSRGVVRECPARGTRGTRECLARTRDAGRGTRDAGCVAARECLAAQRAGLPCFAGQRPSVRPIGGPIGGQGTHPRKDGQEGPGGGTQRAARAVDRRRSAACAPIGGLCTGHSGVRAHRWGWGRAPRGPAGADHGAWAFRNRNRFQKLFKLLCCRYVRREM
jgi:hypothetical protein